MQNGTLNYYPLRHITLRVPWHDAAWNGSICQAPKLNGTCVKLPNIAANRRDYHEEQYAGRSLSDLAEELWPPCVAERGTFMSPFGFTKTIRHPYVESSKETHGHLRPTQIRLPAYSALAIPFLWMRKDNMESYREAHSLDLDINREPKLNFNDGWVQDLSNQQPLLDCFFGHVRPQESLCFFYMKHAPWVEETGRIIAGVGRVTAIAPGVEYEYERRGPLRAMPWERAVTHSIRPDMKDGFLLPYHAALKLAGEDPNFDPNNIVAFAPEDRIREFSFGSEHLTNDGAIAALMNCSEALHRTKQYLDGPWEQQIRWIDARLAEIWKLRGPCPGLGAALAAFGIKLGAFVAYALSQHLETNEDPWPLVEQMFADPYQVLPDNLANTIGSTLCKAWSRLSEERRSLLNLLSRFDISPEQAKMLYVADERNACNIQLSDRELIENPYLLYEATRFTEQPVSLWTVDRGAFPVSTVREKHPLATPSRIDTEIDQRRIRGLTIHALERAASAGNTLLPKSDVILQIRTMNLEPPCPVTEDTMTVAEDIFADTVEQMLMKDDRPAYQLSHLHQVGRLIEQTVLKRSRGRRHQLSIDWRACLDAELDKNGAVGLLSDKEEQARQEKTVALQELAESRFSVLIGPAGTGKTTLLSVLCAQPQIAQGGVLLLAPTGKARVRMEAVAGNLKLQAYTIAQFLYRRDRYDGKAQRYHLSDRPSEQIADTVIVDECSMLTEEMLAALLESLKGVQRFILVGDHRQLPPIGPGRPFVDVVNHLKPENLDSLFPKVAPGYAELTVRRRQTEEIRPDIQLAEWFSGKALPPGEDELFSQLDQEDGDTLIQGPHLRFVQWDTPEEFQEQLLKVLNEELELGGDTAIRDFELKLGGTPHNGSVYFNAQAAKRAEAWQILSPVRGMAHGISDINRLIHKHFRRDTITSARRLRDRKIPKPMGAEEIVYGDKVINIANGARDYWDRKAERNQSGYLANGEIGIAIGQFRTPKMMKPPWQLKVEFSSQLGIPFEFVQKDFDSEDGVPLELAYALTVHKAQGSEFGLVLLVLPNPCRLLTREMLYTALTRQKDRVVVLHQGPLTDLRQYATDHYSDIARRLTNLFVAPEPIEINGRYLENRLIHKTTRGELVRSKSEVIIANLLHANDVDYVYEQKLRLGNQERLPDFTIEDADTGIIYYWEHCGMLHDLEYRKRWERKQALYRQHDILPFEEGGGSNGTLIVTRDSPQGAIDTAEINRIIKGVILS